MAFFKQLATANLIESIDIP